LIDVRQHDYMLRFFLVSFCELTFGEHI